MSSFKIKGFTRSHVLFWFQKPVPFEELIHERFFRFKKEKEMVPIRTFK